MAVEVAPLRRQAWIASGAPVPTMPCAVSTEPYCAEPATRRPVSGSKIARSQSPGPSPSSRAVSQPPAGAVSLAVGCALVPSSRVVQSRSWAVEAVMVVSRRSRAWAAAGTVRAKAAVRTAQRRRVMGL